MADPWYRWPKGLREFIFQRDAYLCQIKAPGCQIKAGDIDHIIPIAAGGDAFEESNLRAACGKCNRGRRPPKGMVRSDSDYPKPSGAWG